MKGNRGAGKKEGRLLNIKDNNSRLFGADR